MAIRVCVGELVDAAADAGSVAQHRPVRQRLAQVARSQHGPCKVVRVGESELKRAIAEFGQAGDRKSVV